MEMEFEFTLTLDGMTGDEFMEKVNLTHTKPRVGFIAVAHPHKILSKVYY